MVKSTTSTPAKPAKKVAAAKTTKPVKKTAKKPAVTEAAATQPECCTLFSPVEVIKAWANGWKNTFNFSGRSSRFELWSLLLLNFFMVLCVLLRSCYVFSERYLIEATQSGYDLQTIDNNIFWAEIAFYLALFIPLFPFGAALVRRLHDLGKVAWNKYFEPLFMSSVVTSLLLTAILEISDTDYVYTAFLLSICFCSMLALVGFHAIKLLIITMFYQGDTKANEFGASQFNDEKHENQALNMGSVFFLTLSFLLLLFMFM